MADGNPLSKEPSVKKLLAGLALLMSLFAVHAAAAGAATIWAVGDGGDVLSNDDALADRIESMGPFDKFLYLGDIYETGTPEEWANYYGPSFGRFKSISAPTPGNHEWANRATGYDPYWGSLAPQPNGGRYYSFDLAGWHIVSLNSETSASATSPQSTWLRQDLARYPGTCTLAFWHKPRYTATANFYGDTNVEGLWTELANHAVVVLNGHHHNYERIKPDRGITQIIAGAGGHLFHSVNKSSPLLEAYQDTKYGALRAELGYGRMDYRYVTSDGNVTDSGSIPCTPHTLTPPPNAPPAASFDYSPASPSTNETVTLTSRSSDSDGTLVDQSWDLDDDGQYDDATGATASRQFAAAGTYTVGLRVTDDDGATATTARSLTVGNQAPTASFSWSPSAPLKRELVTFSSTSADADGRLASQAWDLDNDGQFDDGSATTATRSFPETGKFTVRLRVVDDAGAASIASRVVTVYKKRPPGATKIAAPPLTEPGSNKVLVPRVQILRPAPGAVLRRQPKVLRGRFAYAAGHVQLRLRRKFGRLCQSFDGRHFKRGSCHSARAIFAGTPKRRRWSYRMPIDLPRGRYKLTAIATAPNGRLASQSVAFRMNAPVRVTKPPPPVSDEEYEEGAHP